MNGKGKRLAASIVKREVSLRGVQLTSFFQIVDVKSGEIKTERLDVSMSLDEVMHLMGRVVKELGKTELFPGTKLNLSQHDEDKRIVAMSLREVIRDWHYKLRMSIFVS